MPVARVAPVWNTVSEAARIKLAEDVLRRSAMPQRSSHMDSHPLERLSLEGCERLSDLGCLPLICPNLADVNLSRTSITDHTVISLVCYCRKLQHLAVAKCPWVQGTSTGFVCSLGMLYSRLCSVDFSGLSGVESKVFEAFLKAMTGWAMVTRSARSADPRPGYAAKLSLNLSECSLLEDEAILSLIPMRLEVPQLPTSGCGSCSGDSCLLQELTAIGTTFHYIFQALALFTTPDDYQG
ncbi:hypothetical protein WJX73_006360 [Symbiochloris irregularis]|uniref:Uncharacterized protein n=1 Tax=Symbiochloris irregularis TaxID=706552 RepID=A0AAW1NZL1_9CHLO